MSETTKVESKNPEEDKTPENLSQRLADLEAKLNAEKESKDRILKESQKYKEGYLTYKKSQEELDAKLKSEEEDKLRSKGQYDVLLQQREQRIKELEGTVDNIKGELGSRDTAIVNFRKAAAFERELGGKIRKDDYWTHVDFDKIAINPDTGDIDIHSLKSATDSFIKEYKELVDFGNNANLPNGSARGSGSLTYEAWKKLPLADRKRRMSEVKR